MNKIISQCRKGNRCKQWRTCPECANIRQARIANVAEQGSLSSPYLTFAVVKPLKNGSFSTEKTNLIKEVNKASEGLIWTVETGELTGLHTNLVIGSSTPFDMQTIYKALSVESHVWGNTNLNHKDVRNVASYISKQKGMPDKSEYSGNLYGSMGSWKRPLAIAFEQTISPVIAGIAGEQLLIDYGVPKPEANFMLKPMGKDNGQDIAKRITHNKKEIERIKQATDNHERNANNYKEMQRVLAVLADEIEIKGSVYLKGWGFVGKRELAEFGVIDNT